MSHQKRTLTLLLMGSLWLITACQTLDTSSVAMQESKTPATALAPVTVTQLPMPAVTSTVALQTEIPSPTAAPSPTVPPVTISTESPPPTVAPSPTVPPVATSTETPAPVTTPSIVKLSSQVAQISGSPYAVVEIEPLMPPQCCPTLSPDGRKTAFATYMTSPQGIYVQNSDGSDLQEVSSLEIYNGDGPFPDPIWSPDGQLLAFVNYNYDIYLVKADGTNLTRLEAQGFDPAWSPDGTALAFTSPDMDIYVMEITGGQPRQLTTGEADEQRPAWSPDGQSIAFVSDVDANSHDVNSEIFIMNSDSSNQRRLTDNPAQDWGPVFSPDGRHIVFTSDRSGHNAIYVMNSDGADQRWLMDTETKSRWRIDTTRVRFIDPLHENDLLPAEISQGNSFYAGQSQHSQPRGRLTFFPLPQEEGYIRALAVNPDGRLWAAGSLNLYLFDPFGSVPTWTNVTATNGGPAGVEALLVDVQGQLWAGSGSGVSVFNGENWMSYASVDGLTAGRVLALAGDPVGQIWAGTDEGVSRFDGQSWQAVAGAPAPALSLAVDQAGRLWVGSAAGVQVLDGSTWTAYPTAGGFALMYVNAIVPDPAGNIWVASGACFLAPGECTNTGLSKFDGQNWTNYLQTYFRGFSGIGPVFAVNFDEAGEGWVGANARFMKFDPQTLPSGAQEDNPAWLIYPESSGQIGEVHAIVFDQAGNGWVGGRNGVIQVSQE